MYVNNSNILPLRITHYNFLRITSCCRLWLRSLQQNLPWLQVIIEMNMCDFRSAGVVFLASSIYFYKHWIERMCARGAEQCRLVMDGRSDSNG